MKTKSLSVALLSGSGACRRAFIDALHADAQLRRRNDISAATLFVIWNAFVPADWVSSAFDLSKSGDGYPLRSIHCGNHRTTESN